MLNSCCDREPTTIRRGCLPKANRYNHVYLLTRGYLVRKQQQQHLQVARQAQADSGHCPPPEPGPKQLPGEVMWRLVNARNILAVVENLTPALGLWPFGRRNRKRHNGLDLPMETSGDRPTYSIPTLTNGTTPSC